MRKNVYEILDEFAAAPTKVEKLNVLAKYWTPTLRRVLELTYHPDIKWKVTDFPPNYKVENIPVGMGVSSLDTELRRLYLFQEGNATAEHLTERKRIELLTSLLEALEPREAKVLIGIFKKDLGIKGLNYKFVRDNIPGVVP